MLVPMPQISIQVGTFDGDGNISCQSPQDQQIVGMECINIVTLHIQYPQYFIFYFKGKNNFRLGFRKVRKKFIARLIMDVIANDLLSLLRYRSNQPLTNIN